MVTMGLPGLLSTEEKGGFGLKLSWIGFLAALWPTATTADCIGAIELVLACLALGDRGGETVREVES